MLNKAIKFLIENKIVAVLMLTLFVGWGIINAPFSWNTGFLPTNPVAVDAIPDIGENQQIVFTKWQGRSPQDIEDQITYPLTTSLLGIPGVRTIRSSSMFGFSSIYIIFEEDVEFYWSRSRILEKLNLLSANNVEEILIKNYETGTIDFNDVLDIQELQLKFQINQISAVTTYYLQSAVVNYLINNQ